MYIVIFGGLKDLALPEFALLRYRDGSFAPDVSQNVHFRCDEVKRCPSIRFFQPFRRPLFSTNNTVGRTRLSYGYRERGQI